jgi:hypothetical protein
MMEMTYSHSCSVTEHFVMMRLSWVRHGPPLSQ